MTASSSVTQMEGGATTSEAPTIRELAARECEGVRVLLLWHPREDVVRVSVEDARASHRFELEVERYQALDAFYHPFAYAA